MIYRLRTSDLFPLNEITPPRFVYLIISVLKFKIAHGDVGIRRLVQRFEVGWLYPIVGIDKGYPLAASFVKTEVSGCADSAVGLVDRTDAAIVCGIAVTNGRAFIGRSVIDKEQLKIAERLCEDAVDTLTQIASGIVHRHYYADFRIGQEHF